MFDNIKYVIWYLNSDMHFIHLGLRKILENNLEFANFNWGLKIRISLHRNSTTYTDVGSFNLSQRNIGNGVPTPRHYEST